MVKIGAKVRAKELREAGNSFSFIARTVGASKSTVSVWLANVPYTPNSETLARIGMARAASGAAKNKQKIESIEAAKKEAAKDIGRLSKRDLFLIGLGIYIGEGSKTDTMVRVVNSNPHTMCFMVKWFTEIFRIPKENLRLRLHIYPDSREAECLQFWSKMTTIPKSQFRKTHVDRRQNKRASKYGKLLYGTAHLTANAMGEKRFGVFLKRKIDAFMDIVLNNKRV
ncbi:hypothetical protein EXS56_01425 [Candidatus Kaiserbacteria bacterium]|nr:hypothetical protein [Candidatus Kaiserbacteria bacterium]